MKSITDMFKSKNKVPDNPSPTPIPPPQYHRQDLMPPVFDNDDEYETLEEQRYRFSCLHPMTVLHEVAEKLEGKLTRLVPEDDESTPIVLVPTSMGMCTIIFYKNHLRFTIYETKTFETYCSTKKMITNRNSIYGLQKALEDIEKGSYDKVFADD